MSFEKKQFLIGIPLFAIIYGIIVYLALKTNYAVIILLVFGILAMLVLFKANSIERRIKGDPDEVPNFISFAYFGVLTFIVTIFTCTLLSTINSIHYKINGIETYATIYDINRKVEYKKEYDEDDNVYERKIEECDVYIKYNVDEKEYKTQLTTGSSCKMEIGDMIKIYYDKDDPSKYESDSSPLLIFATAFSGGILVIFLYMTFKETFIEEENKTTKTNKKKKKSHKRFANIFKL